jgi:2-succinyl-5-enolpyruvyl-6-hydroxy-3-cyclohexene-1-carboxylate synthase
MIEKLNPPFMIATFRVYFPTGNFPNTTEPEATYQLEYSSPQELKELYEEARQVWGEYVVEVETDGMIMSSSHTYAEECMASLV